MTVPEIKPASQRNRDTRTITRRTFLAMLGAYGVAPLFAKLPTPSTSTIGSLRRAIVDSPVGVGLHRAEVFTRVYQRHADEPWIVRKALSLREYFETVPLYLRKYDGLAGSISERPGTMPVIVELGIAVLDRRRCTNCGECAAQCDIKALELVGRSVTIDEVLSIVLRDRDYFEASGGGLTLSGGEPLEQPEFVEALLQKAKAKGLHCCIETAGHAGWRDLKRLLDVVDLWLYDFKETNPVRHLKFMGVSNSLILSNLRRLHAAGAAILLRCPMIPEHNARREHLDGIASLARELPQLKGVELLAYYDLWRAKLKRFGLTSELPESVKPPSRSTMDSWNKYLRSRGVRVVSQ